MRVIIDRETNTVSYIDAVESISAPELPFRLPPLTLGLLWRREKPDESLRIRFTASQPGGAEILSLEPDEFILNQDNHRLNIQFGGKEILQVGNMNLKIEQFLDNAWFTAFALSIPINIIETQPMLFQP